MRDRCVRLEVTLLCWISQVSYLDICTISLFNKIDLLLFCCFFKNVCLFIIKDKYHLFYFPFHLPIVPSIYFINLTNTNIKHRCKQLFKLKSVSFQIKPSYIADVLLSSLCLAQMHGMKTNIQGTSTVHLLLISRSLSLNNENFLKSDTDVLLLAKKIKYSYSGKTK